MRKFIYNLLLSVTARELIFIGPIFVRGFPCGSVGKESTCNAGDPSLIPGLGKSTGEGIGYPLQYSCLENSMDRGAWQAPIHEVEKKKVGVAFIVAQLVKNPPAMQETRV